MATITFPLERDERHGWSTYQFRVDGHGFIGLTSDTGPEAANRLKALCDPLADEILAAVLAANEARERNIKALDAGGTGRDWPAFRALDKLRNRLLREAGIKDT